MYMYMYMCSMGRLSEGLLHIHLTHSLVYTYMYYMYYMYVNHQNWKEKNVREERNSERNSEPS